VEGMLYQFTGGANGALPGYGLFFCLLDLRYGSCYFSTSAC